MSNIFEVAEGIVNGPRREEYGPVKDSFEAIAQVWGGILRHPVTAEEVALCMIGLKLVRYQNGRGYDSIVDTAGYARCIELMRTGADADKEVH